MLLDADEWLEPRGAGGSAHAVRRRHRAGRCLAAAAPHAFPRPCACAAAASRASRCIACSARNLRHGLRAVHEYLDVAGSTRAHLAHRARTRHRAQRRRVLAKLQRYARAVGRRATREGQARGSAARLVRGDGLPAEERGRARRLHRRPRRAALPLAARALRQAQVRPAARQRVSGADGAARRRDRRASSSHHVRRLAVPTALPAIAQHAIVERIVEHEQAPRCRRLRASRRCLARSCASTGRLKPNSSTGPVRLQQVLFLPRRPGRAWRRRPWRVPARHHRARRSSPRRAARAVPENSITTSSDNATAAAFNASRRHHGAAPASIAAPMLASSHHSVSCRGASPRSASSFRFETRLAQQRRRCRRAGEHDAEHDDQREQAARGTASTP